jgi:cytochrome b561
MNTAIKLAQAVRAALIAGIALYLLVGERVARGAARGANPDLYLAMTIVAIFTVVAITVLRRVMVLRAERSLTVQPENAAALHRWRAGYLFTYVLSEAVALYGVMLRTAGFTLYQVLPFYAVAFILLIFFSPRRPVKEIG